MLTPGNSAGKPVTDSTRNARPWIRIVGVLLAGALVIGAALQQDAEMPGGDTPWRVKTSNFDVYLSELGEFDAQHFAALASQLPGNKARVIYLAPAGNLVQPGEVVAEFDTSQFKDDLARYTAELAEAEIQLDTTLTELALKQEELAAREQDLRDQLELAQLAHNKLQQVDLPLRLQSSQWELQDLESQLRQAARKRETQRQLADRGFASGVELQAATDLEKKALEQYRAGKARVRLLQEVEMPAELRESEVQLAQARSQLAEFDQLAAQQLRLKEAVCNRAAHTVERLEQRLLEIQAYIKHSVVTSPVAGFVDYPQLTFGKDLRRVQVGDAVWRAQPFVIIPDLQSIIATIKVREVDIGSLAVGQSVQVRPSAFQDVSLPGTVMAVGMLIDTGDTVGDAPERRFEVRVNLQETDPRLRPGMTANVRVHTHHYDDALLLPVEAVYFDNRQSFTYVNRNQAWQKQVLELGGSDGQFVSVMAGLDAGDAVAYSPSPDWLVDD